MIISEVNTGKKAKYNLSGTVLSVAGVEIDLQQRQEDMQKIVDISLGRDMQVASEGVGSWYVATIVIPPRQRELYLTDELDEDGNKVMAERDMPLDISKVELKLWGLPESYGQEQNITQEESEVL